MSINNREDLNRYSKIVNDLVDEFIAGNKIRPSNLKRYLKPEKKMDRFLKKNNLSEVKGIKKVLKDVIDSYSNMESDGVMKFENFKLLESSEYGMFTLSECLVKGIGKPNIEEEKFLADHFDANLSQVDILDFEKHLYKITTWDGEIKAVTYSKEDFEIIKGNITEFLTEEFMKKEIELVYGIRIELSKVVDEQKLATNISMSLNFEKICDMICGSLEVDGWKRMDFGKFIVISE